GRQRCGAEVLPAGPDAPGTAVVVVLKRPADARRDGDVVAALLGGVDGPVDLVVGAGGGRDPHRFDPAACAGVVAADLFAVACAVRAGRHRAGPRPDAPARAWPGDWTAEVATAAGPGRRRTADAVPWVAGAPVALRVYSGADRAGVAAALA
ncbi:hypothetical protein J7S33_29595, partial [Saccharothrix algeriensis]